MIVESTKEQLRGAGSQRERYARCLNMSFASRGIAVSPPLIARLMKAAGIISAGVLRIKDTPKIGAKFCAKAVKIQRMFQHKLSAYGMRVGLDQMKNLKCNTNANAETMGKRTIYQLKDERQMTHGHGAGGDHLCKFGMEALLLEGVRAGSVSFPEHFDLSAYVPGYSADKFFSEQPALAHMFVHIQEREPESAFRDFADLAEFVTRFPHRFLTPELKLMPFFFIERDNAHGVGTVETRFCAVLFSLLHGIYYLSMISQESGRSRWHRVEQVNGAASKAVMGEAFDLPMNVPENAPEEVKRDAQDEVQQQIINKFPATYKAGGAEDGFVSVEKPRSTLLACGFEWRTRELRAFVDAAKKGAASMNAFCADAASFAPMPLFDHPLGYGGLLQQVWRLLHVTGSLKCTKLTAHSFEFKSNLANPGCPPPDPESQAAIDILESMLQLEGVGQHAVAGAKGDGFLPQPRPARWREGQEYADLDEMLACGGATEIDEFYPKLQLDMYIKGSPQLLTIFTQNHSSLPPLELKKLTEMLVVDEGTLYAELAERVNKEEYKNLYESMKSRQENDGTLEYISAIVAGLIGKPDKATKSWPHVPDLKAVINKLPGKTKVPVNPKRAVLIQLIAFTWRQLPESQRPVLRPVAAAPVAARAAPAAPVVPAPVVAAPVVVAPVAAAGTAAGTPVLPVLPVVTAPGTAPVTTPVTAPVTAPVVAPVVAAAAPVLPPPPPPFGLQDAHDELRLITGADMHAEDIVDAADEAQADELAAAAAADALVDTVLDMVDAKKCGLCYQWFEVAGMQWDSGPYCYVCKDGEACVLRRPGARGKRARRPGSYASMSR